MHQAAYEGNLELVQKFIKEGIPAFCFDANGCTPLFYAVRNQHKKVAEYLLDICPGLQNVPTNSGNLPLHVACGLNSAKLFKLLIRPVRKEDYPFIPSELLAKINEETVLSVNQQNSEGHTPLFFAVEFASLGMVKKLIELGASLDIKSSDMIDIVKYAEYRGKTDMYEYLKELPRNTEGKSSDLINALKENSVVFDSEKVKKMATEKGLSKDAKTGLYNWSEEPNSYLVETNKVLSLLKLFPKDQFSNKIEKLLQLYDTNILQNRQIFQFQNYHIPYCGVVLELPDMKLSTLIHTNQYKYGEDILKQLTLDLVRGISYLHRFGLVHKAIQPSNIYIKTTGDSARPYIAKLGLIAVDEKDAYDRYHNKSILYTAPEGNEKAPSDIYSLGVTLWEMIVRDHPWSDKYCLPAEVQASNSQGKFFELHGQKLTEQSELVKIVQGCTLLQPESRFSATQIETNLMTCDLI
uniref:Protein kinase domain-containing protein n=1 Tax=Arcella intermedia TaxID=1963864 RepID=A0A6B2L3E1_9EUKA